MTLTASFTELPALSSMPVWNGVLRIIPAGIFNPTDGRKVPANGWRIDAASAARVIEETASGGKDIVIDYEHQTLYTEKNGQPAPAAGWFSKLEWRECEGLVATDVRWTERAKAAIKAGEYRYISPVFSFDPETGYVRKIGSVALTNNPALAGLVDLGAIAVNSSHSQADAGVKDTLHSMDSFNQVFAGLGVCHPDTPAAQREAIFKEQSRVTEPQKIPLGMTEREAECMRHTFPGVFLD